MRELIRRLVKTERDMMILRCGRLFLHLSYKLEDAEFKLRRAQIWCIRKARKILQKLHESE